MVKIPSARDALAAVRRIETMRGLRPRKGGRGKYSLNTYQDAIDTVGQRINSLGDRLEAAMGNIQARERGDIPAVLMSKGIKLPEQESLILRIFQRHGWDGKNMSEDIIKKARNDIYAILDETSENSAGLLSQYISSIKKKLEGTGYSLGKSMRVQSDAEKALIELIRKGNKEGRRPSREELSAATGYPLKSLSVRISQLANKRQPDILEYLSKSKNSKRGEKPPSALPSVMEYYGVPRDSYLSPAEFAKQNNLDPTIIATILTPSYINTRLRRTIDPDLRAKLEYFKTHVKPTLQNNARAARREYLRNKWRNRKTSD